MNTRILGSAGAGCALGACETTGALVEGRSFLGGAPHATNSASTIVATTEHSQLRISPMITRPAREPPWVHRSPRLEAQRALGAGGCNWLQIWLEPRALGPGTWPGRERGLIPAASPCLNDAPAENATREPHWHLCASSSAAHSRQGTMRHAVRVVGACLRPDFWRDERYRNRRRSYRSCTATLATLESRREAW